MLCCVEHIGRSPELKEDFLEEVAFKLKSDDKVGLGGGMGCLGRGFRNRGNSMCRDLEKITVMGLKK